MADKEGAGRKFVPVALHGRNGYTLLYGLPPASGYGVNDPHGNLVMGFDRCNGVKFKTTLRFKTAKGARISAALRNRGLTR